MSTETLVLSIIYMICDVILSTAIVMALFDVKRKKLAFTVYAITRASYHILYLFTVEQSISITLLCTAIGSAVSMLVIYCLFDKNIGRGMLKTFLLQFMYSLFSMILNKIPFLQLRSCETLFNDDEDYIRGVLFIIVIYPFTLPFALIIKKAFHKIGQNSKIYTFATIISLLTIAGTAILGILTDVNLNNSYVFVSMTIFVFFVAIIKITSDFNTQKKLTFENAYLNQLNKLQYEHYDALNQHQQEIRMMRHDIVNHLHTMQILLENGEREKCCSYTQEIMSSYKSQYINYCENKIIDAVLHNKLSCAVENGISCSADICVSDNIGITPVDLVCIFTNILDNAIDAATNSTDKKITIKATQKNNSLIIKCCNSYSGNIVIKKDFTLKTTKNDNFSHGLGISIVKKAAEKYGGNIMCNTKDNAFDFTVVVPFTNESSEKQNDT